MTTLHDAPDLRHKAEFIKAHTGIEESISLLILREIEAGSTLPFLARYRQHLTKNLEESKLREVFKQASRAKTFLERKESILQKLKEKDHLDSRLEKRIAGTLFPDELEELYAPYKTGRSQVSTRAKEAGLNEILSRMLKYHRREDSKIFQPRGEFKTKESILQGVEAIFIEQIRLCEKCRKLVFQELQKHGEIQVTRRKNAVDEKEIYRSYYDRVLKVRFIREHQVLAILRGEREKVLKVSIHQNARSISLVNTKLTRCHGIRPNLAYYNELEDFYQKALSKSLLPSIQRELRNKLFEQAKNRSLEVFAKNLRSIFCALPIQKKRVLGLDPGFAHGCKAAYLNEFGGVIHCDKYYFHKKNRDQVVNQLLRDLNKYKVDLVAIGNGTASRETELILSELIEENQLNIQYMITNEAGASVYSACELAQKELPDLDVSLRGAVSIGRRIIDPLGELVKIPVESLGVGMYQHDIPKRELKERLSSEASYVISKLGVDANKASKELLLNIEGFGPGLASKFIEYRTKSPFQNRKEMKNVPGLGEKTFELVAGFLKVHTSSEPLDQTIVHPQHYKLVKRITREDGAEANEKIYSSKDLQMRFQIDKDEAETIAYCLNHLSGDMKQISLEGQIKSRASQFGELKEGQKLKGVIRNIVDFGIFVDIGVGQDGMIPARTIDKKHLDRLNSGECIFVEVTGIDSRRSRIELGLVTSNPPEDLAG